MLSLMFPKYEKRYIHISQLHEGKGYFMQMSSLSPCSALCTQKAVKT